VQTAIIERLQEGSTVSGRIYGSRTTEWHEISKCCIVGIIFFLQKTVSRISVWCTVCHSSMCLQFHKIHVTILIASHFFSNWFNRCFFAYFHVQICLDFQAFRRFRLSWLW
jgi:hypothetical protein